MFIHIRRVRMRLHRAKPALVYQRRTRIFTAFPVIALGLKTR